MKNLVEKMNDSKQVMKNMLDTIENEGRAFTAEEKAKFEALRDEVLNIDETLTIADKIDAIDNRIVETNLEPKDKVEIKQFANFLRSGIMNTGEVAKGDNTKIIPSTIASKVLEIVEEVCPIYARATKYNVKGTLSIPKYVKNGSDDVTVAYGEDFVAPSSHAGKLDSITLTGFYANALVEISKGLINNTDIDLVNYFARKLAEKFAKWLEKECLYGTSSKIVGVVGSYDATNNKVTLASSSKITTDELINIQDLIPDVYQANAEWYLNKATRSVIRKLKDGDGKYLLNPDLTAKWGYTLLGKPVYCSDNIKKLGTQGNEVIFYGDFSGLAVKLVKDITVDILDDSYFKLRNSIGILGTVEVDAKVENTQKIAVAVAGTAA